MISFRDLHHTFHSFPISEDQPLLVHISPDFSHRVQGGVKSVLGALKGTFRALLMPAFTYQTMVFPKTGPKDNGVEYNNPPIDNKQARFFSPDLPVSPELGDIPEAFRNLSGVQRSSHPLLSFSGLNLDEALAAQRITHPYAPVAFLAEKEGWILLIDVGQSQNFSIHYGQYKGGRELFTRWALTSAGIKTCPHFPGCSKGFVDLQPQLEEHSHPRKVGGIAITALPLAAVVKEVQNLLDKNSLALLCNQAHCLPCSSIRARQE